jgi:hypothetical protein
MKGAKLHQIESSSGKIESFFNLEGLLKMCGSSGVHREVSPNKNER